MVVTSTTKSSSALMMASDKAIYKAAVRTLLLLNGTLYTHPYHFCIQIVQCVQHRSRLIVMMAWWHTHRCLLLLNGGSLFMQSLSPMQFLLSMAPGRETYQKRRGYAVLAAAVAHEYYFQNN